MVQTQRAGQESKTNGLKLLATQHAAVDVIDVGGVVDKEALRGKPPNNGRIVNITTMFNQLLAARVGPGMIRK